MVTRRTDPHAPATLVASDYAYVLSYALPCSDGFSFNVQAARDFAVQHEAEFFHGGEHRTWGIGRCSVCGARFNMGDIWRHTPTGQYIHIGHECAAKYDMVAECEEFEEALSRRAKDVLARQREGARQQFLAEHPGLAEDFEVGKDHPVIADIAASLARYPYLSVKQVALVRKLAAEIRNPPEPERHVTAPTGKVEFTGTVISAKVKAYEGTWGIQYRSVVTVKVETPEGSWLAWGTLPKGIDEDFCGTNGYKLPLDEMRGLIVRIKATLEPGKDAHFALMTRPSGSIVDAGSTAYAPIQICAASKERASRARASKATAVAAST